MRDRITQARARELRLQLTDAERQLWKHIRVRQIGDCRFRRQVPIRPYVADFACLDPAMVIEVDGGQHANQKNYDTERDEFLARKGFRVLRFWNNEVLLQTDAVLEVIRRALEELKMPPP